MSRSGHSYDLLYDGGSTPGLQLLVQLAAQPTAPIRHVGYPIDITNLTRNPSVGSSFHSSQESQLLSRPEADCDADCQVDGASNLHLPAVTAQLVAQQTRSAEKGGGLRDVFTSRKTIVCFFARLTAGP